MCVFVCVSCGVWQTLPHIFLPLVWWLWWSFNKKIDNQLCFNGSGCEWCDVWEIFLRHLKITKDEYYLGGVGGLCCPLQRCHCQSLVLGAVRLVAGADQWLVESHRDGQHRGNSGHLRFWGWYQPVTIIQPCIFFVVWSMFLCLWL